MTMTATTEHTIKTLNGLVEVTVDSIVADHDQMRDLKRALAAK